MDLSPELVRAIELASKALNGNNSGELVLPARKLIWSAMGPCKMEGTRAIVGPGLQRRTRLAVLAVRHVLPIWERALPTNREPQRMLEIAEEYLGQVIDFRTAWNLKNQFWGELESGRISDRRSIAIAVGFGAAKVVTTALNDQLLDSDNLESELLDHNLDPYQWDASFYASVAYAGSAPWQAELNADGRRKFWEWYIKVAVPRAWDSVS
jgi:hypothetical protein